MGAAAFSSTLSLPSGIDSLGVPLEELEAIVLGTCRKDVAENACTVHDCNDCSSAAAHTTWHRGGG